MHPERAAGQASRISLHGHWSSRMAFILAVTGSAVGLGNIWKFPYVAGQNGGGAFVLVYLFCVFMIGMPAMMSEILIGRRGRRNPIATMALLGEEEGHSRHWQWVGAMGVVAGMLILSYYSVVAGWTLAYVQKSMSGVFAGASAAEVSAVFAAFTSSWVQTGVAHTVFMASTIFVVARGVERGLEQAVKIMVPGLLLLMLVLLGYAINSGSFGLGLAFMFSPNFAALTWDGVLVAMGQAFFTLSLGMGAVMAYGAYLPEETSITSTSAAVVGGVTWLVGWGTVLSFNVLRDFTFFKGTIYNNIDYVTTNVMLPLGGLFVTVFAAWVMCRNSSADELGGARATYKLWRFLARYVAPVAIAFIFLHAVGVLE